MLIILYTAQVPNWPLSQYRSLDTPITEKLPKTSLIVEEVSRRNNMPTEQVLWYRVAKGIGPGTEVLVEQSPQMPSPQPITNTMHE
jgi:hypothetical protein